MTKSMTGYGRSEKVFDDKSILIEVKSVNHRYFEFSCRLPRNYAFLEEKIKSVVASRVSRGKIDVFVTINTLESTGTLITVDHARAEGYYNAINQIADQFNLRNDLSASVLSRFPDILTIQNAPLDEDLLWSQVSAALSEALDGFVAMRENEGAKMKADVLSRTSDILSKVDLIDGYSEQSVKEYCNKLQQRLNDLLSDIHIDEQRILTEAAIFADKTAVAEETVRLRSHISQFESLFESKEPIGRKLDFIVQEMNRETNTIGSKSQNIEITRIVVDIKSEIEKIREQVQNIE